jgi:hypothetical protein
MKKTFLPLLFLPLIILSTQAQVDSLSQHKNNSAENLGDLFSEIKEQNRPVIASFKATHIISAQSNETVKKNELQFLVAHRFGDAGGEYGGAKTFFGLDNSTDIKLSFDYGITNRLSVGIARAKGATAIRQLVEGNLKYKLIQQTIDNNVPISITVFGNAVISTMESNIKTNVPDHFDSFSDRWSFTTQAIIVRKFNSSFTLALLPTYINHNQVLEGDQNGTFALGVGGRLKFTKRLALIADYFYTFRSDATLNFYKSNGLNFYNHLGVGIEIETGGHVFQLSFMNSGALLENQFIPYTTSNWSAGQFRWGFGFGRTFPLKKHL